MLSNYDVLTVLKVWVAENFTCIESMGCRELLTVLKVWVAENLNCIESLGRRELYLY